MAWISRWAAAFVSDEDEDPKDEPILRSMRDKAWLHRRVQDYKAACALLEKLHKKKAVRQAWRFAACLALTFVPWQGWVRAIFMGGAIIFGALAIAELAEARVQHARGGVPMDEIAP